MKLRTSPQTLQVLAHFLENAGGWQYGYDISRVTGLKSGTLYPILMRLAELGFLEARWDLESGAKPRHAYRLTGTGKRHARQALPQTSSASSLKTALARGGRA